MKGFWRTASVVGAALAAAGCGASAGAGGPSPVAAAAVEMPPPGPWDRPGFRAFEVDERLWVFRDGSPGLKAYVQHGEPARSVTRPGVGPGRRTMRSDSLETIYAYLSVQDGFETLVNGKEIWVARAGSDEIRAFLQNGPPPGALALEGAGPAGATLRGSDPTALEEYRRRLAAETAAAPSAGTGLEKPGFFTKVVDGRLWVFRADSKDVAEFLQHGEPAKSVTLPGKGPNGMTIRSGDRATIEAYMAAK